MPKSMRSDNNVSNKYSRSRNGYISLLKRRNINRRLGLIIRRINLGVGLVYSFVQSLKIF